MRRKSARNVINEERVLTKKTGGRTEKKVMEREREGNGLRKYGVLNFTGFWFHLATNRLATSQT